MLIVRAGPSNHLRFKDGCLFVHGHTENRIRGCAAEELLECEEAQPCNEPSVD
jgi:hypothetical protein